MEGVGYKLALPPPRHEKLIDFRVLVIDTHPLCPTADSIGHNPLPGSIGNFYWTGAWGTTFWVDPKERLIAIQMIQTATGLNSAYRHAFRNLTYAAMTGSEPAR